MIMHYDPVSLGVFYLAAYQQQGSSLSLTGIGFAPFHVESMYRGSLQMESNMRVIAYNVRHMHKSAKEPMKNAFLSSRIFVQMFYFSIFQIKLRNSSLKEYCPKERKMHEMVIFCCQSSYPSIHGNS